MQVPTVLYESIYSEEVHIFCCHSFLPKYNVNGD